MASSPSKNLLEAVVPAARSRTTRHTRRPLVEDQRSRLSGIASAAPKIAEECGRLSAQTIPGNGHECRNHPLGWVFGGAVFSQRDEVRRHQG